MSLNEIKIFKFVVFNKSSFPSVFDKFNEAFSTNKCGLGKGLYEILPFDLI